MCKFGLALFAIASVFLPMEAASFETDHYGETDISKLQTLMKDEKSVEVRIRQMK